MHARSGGNLEVMGLLQGKVRLLVGVRVPREARRIHEYACVHSRQAYGGLVGEDILSGVDCTNSPCHLGGQPHHDRYG